MDHQQEQHLSEKLAQLSQLLINSDNAYIFSSRLLNLFNNSQISCSDLIEHGFLPTLISLVEQPSARELLSKLKIHHIENGNDPIYPRLITIAIDLQTKNESAYNNSLKILTILSTYTSYSKILRQLCFPGLVLKLCWPDLLIKSIESPEITNSNTVQLLSCTYLLTFLANTCINDIKTKSVILSSKQFTSIMLQILSKHSKKIQTTAYDNCDASISAQTSLTFAALYLLKNTTYGMHDSLIKSIFDTNSNSNPNQSSVSVDLFSFILQCCSSGNNKLAHTSLEFIANISAFQYFSVYFTEQTNLIEIIFQILPSKVNSKYYSVAIILLNILSNLAKLSESNYFWSKIRVRTRDVLWN